MDLERGATANRPPPASVATGPRNHIGELAGLNAQPKVYGGPDVTLCRRLPLSTPPRSQSPSPSREPATSRFDPSIASDTHLIATRLFLAGPAALLRITAFVAPPIGKQETGADCSRLDLHAAVLSSATRAAVSLIELEGTVLYYTRQYNTWGIPLNPPPRDIESLVETHQTQSTRARPSISSLGFTSTVAANGQTAQKKILAATSAMDIDPYSASQPVHRQDQSGHDSGTNSSQSQAQSITNSQNSNASSATDQVATPPGSDASSGVERPPIAVVTAMLKNRYANVRPDLTTGASSQDSQLHQLSAIAAVQDRLVLEAAGLSRKRMADGEVKDGRGSMSPVKGHSRTTSAVSVASTAGSTIGELSAELRTRLSYAMVKVNNGWQARNLDEVESLASQVASPASSTSTVHRRKGSSASPRLPATATSSQAQPTHESMNWRGKSNSPPSANSNKPALAPPAPIQPSSSMPAPRSNPRRNSNPRYTPTMLSHSHSASAHTSAQTTPISNGIKRWQSHLDPNMYSPHHKNVREQDAIETLLFMSSPGNSANLRHTFSPSGSPGPQPSAPPRSVGERHALPNGPRRGLPASRPPPSAKKVGFDKSPGVPRPHSPMDLDSPQHQSYTAHSRSAPKRQATSMTSRHRTTLSLPSGLGLGNGTARRVLRDEDIERMLDHAGAELADSSDDEEIQLPPGRNRLAGAMGI